ncbi:PP0621 family protein [Helicobacter pametensis]|uniref:PP0621 family protein n=1 Tax=Helicobacter pametensis TaxID=95149 RepID=UPI000486932B|nr:PP0621 family protein [Helicobacter pametensis]
MLKTLLILGIIALIIWFFFIKKRPTKTNHHPQADSMVECQKCKTFIMQNEAILSNGSYYCSKECLLQG